MKKGIRILALLGAILLAGLYLSTLVFAFWQSELALQLLKSSVALTILLPILLYAFFLIGKVSCSRKQQDQESQNTKER
ncbi:MAG: hypothetical protein HFH53_10575 [Hespellia sp.]|jgi:hypothetical protein|nr:hypothetical protein [Hespellia sp.]